MTHAKCATWAVTALLVLLISTSNMLVAAPPNCNPPSTRTVTAFSSGGTTIQVTAPNTYRNCPINGCCDTITITGVPAGWRIVGNLISSFVFTTKCINGQPAYPPQGRLTLQTIPVDVTSTGAAILLKVCWPNVHDWPSFETHVDVQLDIRNAAGTLVGVIGPGTDWDLFCNTVGCTPGKWKNWTGLGTGNQTNLWPSPYNPSSTTFFSAFGRTYSQPPGIALTMLQALNLGGSGENGMARHCTAALLNARWAQLMDPLWQGNVCQNFANGTPDVSEVIGWVRGAYDGLHSFSYAMNKCAEMNESLCALDGVWMTTTNGNSECAAVNPGTPCNP